MSYYCGIDIGASTAKLVLINEHGDIVAKALRKSGVDYARTADELLELATMRAEISRGEIVRSLATGYGRENVPWADERKTEIACHGKGAYHHFRRAITIIDIGAQDSKIIHLDKKGKRTGFRMNRKCAAGTGAFLEEIALRMSIPVSDMNGLAERSSRKTSLSSFCTVFAATEVLERIRKGDRVEDIVRGAYGSVVKRIIEMDTIAGNLVMTGGVVAHNPFLATMLGDAFEVEALMPPNPQYAGAFGAALFAAKAKD